MRAEIFDVIVIGAGPGGLQAAIYLGRYNRKVLVLDRPGGRTRHARHIENFLSQPLTTGVEIINTGTAQARHFGARVERATVSEISKQDGLFLVKTKETDFRSRFVIASTGATDILPGMENIFKFFGESFFTCLDCDGYRTTGKKLAIIGKNEKTLRLAFAMKQMYTREVTVILLEGKIPPGYEEELKAEGIKLVMGEPLKLLGEEEMEGIQMKTGEVISCERVLSNLGYRPNDDFLAGLGLKKDEFGFQYVTNRHYESSMNGLYLLGPLTGNDQAIIAAGEGAIAAIDLNKRLFEFYLAGE